MPDGVTIPGGPSFGGYPQPPDVPCDPTGDGWRGPAGPQGPQGPMGPSGIPGDSVVNVLDHGAKGDGTTNDTVAIQNVISSYAGKATILVPDTGNPYMCSPLVPHTGTDLLIYGTLKLRPASPNALIVVNANTSRVTLRGNGILDGNGAAQTNPMTIGNVYVNQSSTIRIYGLTLQNANAWNLNVVQCSDVVVDGVTMLGGANSNEFASGSDNCWLTNCTIDGPASDIGFSFYGGVTNSGAIGNVVRNSGVAGHQVAGGINVLCDAAQPAACSNIVITGNIVYNSWGAGITVDRGSGSVGQHQNVTISGNRVYSNNLSNAAQQSDISAAHCTNVVINGNLVSSNENGTAATYYGIYVATTATDTTVTANAVANIGMSGAPGFGFYVNSSNVLLVNGNSFHDFRGTRYMTAIGGTAGLFNVFSNNLFGQLAAGAPISITVQSDTVVSNAVGASGWSFGIGAASLQLTKTGIVFPTGTHAIGLNWSGTAATVSVDGTAEGNVLTDTYVATRPNAANDAAAASAGVGIGQVYLNGSAMMVRKA
jgi:hypothetical protein